MSVRSLGRDAGLLDGEVADVRLLGYDGALEWERTGEALRIVCPDRMPFSSAVVFRIGPE